MKSPVIEKHAAVYCFLDDNDANTAEMKTPNFCVVFGAYIMIGLCGERWFWTVFVVCNLGDKGILRVRTC